MSSEQEVKKIMANKADEKEKIEREIREREKARRYWNYMERRHKGDRKKK